MEDKKTDMLTPEQFNSFKEQKKSNCLGFAIGVEGRIELDYWGGIEAGDSFERKVSEYGLKVKKVQTLEEIKGKTGFIVYGFYNRRDWFTRELIMDDFHIVRVNPDGSLVHKQDDIEPAKHVKLTNDKGGIHEYDGANEPIYLFTLEEEKNIDRVSVQSRAETVLTRAKQILTSASIDSTDKEKIIEEMTVVKESLNNTLNSNEINILLQKISELTRKYEKDKDGPIVE